MSVMEPQERALLPLPARSAFIHPLGNAGHDGRSRRLRWAAWLVRAFWFLCVLFSIYVFIATNPSRARQMQDVFTLNGAAFRQFGFDRESLSTYMIALDSLTFLSYALVGFLIFWRKSSDWVAFFGSLALVTTGITLVRPNDSLFFVDPTLHLPILLLFTLGTGSIVLFLYLFPDGHFKPGWIVWPALASCGFSLVPQLQQVLALSTSEWPPPSLAATAVPALALASAAQLYYYRRMSSPAQRQQTRWVVYGLAVGSLGLVTFILIVPTFIPQVLEEGIERAAYFLIGVPLFYFSLVLLPLSIAMSILRFRLWDIDLLIRQTVLYGVLTAVVAGMYAAFITLGQKIFLSLTGQRSDMAGVIATLLVVAAITPLKDLIQRTVDQKLKGSPDPAVRLQALVDRVHGRISQVEPHQISRRLVDEAVGAFSAKGGAVYWQVDGRLNLIYRTADWDGDPRVSADLGSDLNHRMGVVALSTRRNGEGYTENHKKVLQEVASAIALAIEQDRQQS